MKAQLENIYSLATEDIAKAASISDLDEIRAKYLSRKGEFNEIKKNLKNLSDEDKRIIGSLANEITKKLETSIQTKHDEFYKKELNQKLEKERIDVSLPGKFTPKGRIHPLTSTTNEIVSILQSLGFSVVESKDSPEVETEYFNFDMLNIPKELFTPLFAIARIAGWSAHRIEELTCANKIIRPAYMSVAENTEYVPINER